MSDKLQGSIFVRFLGLRIVRKGKQMTRQVKSNSFMDGLIVTTLDNPIHFSSISGHLHS